jgi:RNA polymerase sigma factor (sigma-70 family)
MKPRLSFTELIERVRSGDEQAASELVKQFEPVVRRELRFRLRDNRARFELDSMDISQSVLGNFFVRMAARQYDLKEQRDLVKLLVTMTRNKVAENLRTQHRQRRDSRRTVRGVEGMALASAQPTPSRVLAGREILDQVRQNLSGEERQLIDLRWQGLTWEEIADSLGGTADARRKQMARALDEIIHKLGLDEYEASVRPEALLR